jgi:hypothetical protein
MAESKKEDEFDQIREMNQLHEETLIKKGVLYFLLPWFLAGVLGSFFPYVFAFIPSSEGIVCTCAFYQKMY